MIFKHSVSTSLAARRLLWSLPVLGVLAAAGAASADTGVYRSVLADGRVIYGDKPADHATASRSLVVFRSSGLGTGVTQAAIDGMNKRKAERADKLDDAQTSSLKKLAAVKAAKEAKLDGVNPLPGERKQLDVGASVLSEAYFARQQRLEDAVVEAEKAYAAAGNELRRSL